MDSNKRWFFAAILVIALGLGLTAVVNYIIDPYGIFRKDFSYQFIEPNKHYIKARYVGENPDKYDCFVFGSSRANNIDVRKIKNGRCYNMQFAGGLPREYLDTMKYMVKKGVNIKFALIALDEVSFQYNPIEHLSQPMRHPYPPVMGEPLFPYYLQYLFFYYDWKIMKVCINGYVNKLRGIIKEGPVHHDMYETGQTFSPAEDLTIEKDPVAHANKPAFEKRFRPEDVYMEGVIKDLKDLVGFAKENRIQLKFFIVPLYSTKYLDSGPNELDRFKRALSKIADFWDFSGLNSITTNKYYYYETWHFRTIVGDMVLSRLIGNKDVTVPEDFGVLVTAQNVDSHLQYLRQQMEEYLKKTKQ
jgi:hypothetical protein